MMRGCTKNPSIFSTQLFLVHRANVGLGTVSPLWEADWNPNIQVEARVLLSYPGKHDFCKQYFMKDQVNPLVQ